jgi:hypothetical protein
LLITIVANIGIVFAEDNGNNLEKLNLNENLTNNNLTNNLNDNLTNNLNENLNNSINENINKNINKNNHGTDNINIDTDTNHDLTNYNPKNSNLKNINDNTQKAAGSILKSYDIKHIYKIASSLKNYIDKNKKLPDYLSVDGSKIGMSEVLYLLSKTTVNLNSKKTIAVTLKEVKDPTNPTGSKIIKGTIKKTNYIVLAKNLVSYMEKYKKAPNYASNSAIKVPFQSIVDGFTRIVNYYSIKKTLPSYVSYNTKNTALLNKYIPNYNGKNVLTITIAKTPSDIDTNNDTNTDTNTNTKNDDDKDNDKSTEDTTLKSYSITTIYKIATSLKNYISKNKKLPDYMVVDGKKLRMSQVLYLLSKATANLNSKKTSTITLKEIKDPTNPTGSKIIKGTVKKTYYISLVKNLVNYLEKNKKAPNYASVNSIKIPYQSIIDGLTRVVSYYSVKKTFPSYISYNTKNTALLNTYDPKYAGKNGLTITTISKPATPDKNDSTKKNETNTTPNTNKTKNKNGIWLFASDMMKVDFNLLSEYGIKNIFLNEHAFTLYSDNTVKSWMNNGSKYGIKTHIWIQAFYSNGKWINPINTTTGKVNQNYLDSILSKVTKYVKLGVDGIHYDYLRYPGTAYKTNGSTKAITNFVKDTRYLIDTLNPNVIFSAATMWETTQNEYYYGQNISELGKYLDVIIPMIYRYNQKGLVDPGAEWITSTAQWFKANSGGAEIWGGLMGYIPLDEEETKIKKLTSNELAIDYNSLLKGGVEGVVFFRYTIANLFNLNTFNASNLNYTNQSNNDSNTKTISISSILNASSNIKKYFDTNKRLPNYVEINKVKYSMADYLYLASQAIANLNSKNTNNLNYLAVKDPDNPSGSSIIKGNLTKANYLNLANKIIQYIKTNKNAPNNGATDIGTLYYQSIVESFSRCLDYYQTHKALPNYISYNTKSSDSLNTNIPKYITDTGNSNSNSNNNSNNNNNSNSNNNDNNKNKNNSSANLISLSEIINAVSRVKKFIDSNGQLPNYVTINSKQYNMGQYLYLITTAINNLNTGKTNSITIINVTNAIKSNGNLKEGSLNKSEYIDVAKRVLEHIKKYEQSPNYASCSLGNIPFDYLIESFSRVLIYYLENSKLPNNLSYQETNNYDGGGDNSNLTSYLVSDDKSQMSNLVIKNLAKKITNGMNTTIEKAKAIYNYVRDTIMYSFYYNTKYGAVEAYNKKIGNCVDMSHLIIGLSRASGIPARYVHGKCTFTSGKTYGHVWAEIYVDGEWLVADATSIRNSLGKINNWNTNTYTFYNKYSTLGF